MARLPGMQRALKPTSRFGTVAENLIKLVVAAVATVLAAIALYLFALLNVYIIAWVVELLEKIF
jgi:hypothetical protein